MEDTITASTYLPWDTSAGNRFAHYSSENHSAPLWIAALLGLIYMVGVLLIRAFIKRRVFGWDDYLITASSITALGQFIVIYGALKSDLGKTSANVQNVRLVGKLVFSSRVLFLASLYLAKFSVLFLLRRLFVRDQRSIQLLWNLNLGFVVISSLVSVFISTVRCPSSGIFAQHCSSQITRWSIVTALDIGTEAVMLLLPPYLVWHLQMRVGNKLRVIAAFWFRLVVIILSVLYLNAWISYTTGPPSPLLIVQSLVWQQGLLVASLITASIPNLKAFLQSLSANWGEPDFGYTSRKNYGNDTYELKNLNSVRPTVSRTVETSVPHPVQENSDFETQVYTSTREAIGRSSLGSGGSQDLIIRKETTWIVERT